MYHGDSPGRNLRAGRTGGHYSTAGPRSSSSGHGSDRHMSYPTYSNTDQHRNSPNIPLAATGDDWEYEERPFHPSVQGRASMAMERGYPTPPRSSYSSPPVLDQSRSWEATSHQSSGPPRSATSLPQGLEAHYYNSNQQRHRMSSFPGAFPYPYDQSTDAVDYSYQPPASSSSHGYFHTTPLHEEAINALFGINAPHHHPGHRSTRPPVEMLPNFPQWSRTWYDGHLSSNGHAYTSVPPPAGQVGWESDSYSRSGYSGVAAGLNPYGDLQGPGDRYDIIKEERLRMLEKEFGKAKVSSSRRGKGNDEGDTSEDTIGDDEELALGSVTSTGRLVTERPKTMMAVRWMIGFTTLAGCLCGLGGALLVKTTSSTDKPAPQGTLPAYLLYGCSVVSLVLLLYLYVFRPCCCDPMRKEVKSGAASSGNPLAGMVIPVLSGGGPGAKPGKKPKMGKRGQQQQQQQMPTVNLIVDPAFFSKGNDGTDDDDSSKEDDSDRLPGDARRSKKRKHGLGVLGNIQMQRRWQLARSKVKLHMTWDAVLLLVWIACDIVCLGLGKKCPANAGSWCTFYNAALACGVINAVLLCAALFLDYRDLKISRNAPKPPM